MICKHETVWHSFWLFTRFTCVMVWSEKSVAGVQRSAVKQIKEKTTVVSANQESGLILFKQKQYQHIVSSSSSSPRIDSRTQYIV